MACEDCEKETNKLLKAVQDLVKVEEKGVEEWSTIANAIVENQKRLGKYEIFDRILLVVIELSVIAVGCLVWFK